MYDGETNVGVIVLSSAYLFFVTLELDRSRRLLVVAAYSVILVFVPLLVDSVYVSIAVGRFCKLPCTSDGMSVVAMTSIGFVLVPSLTGLSNVVREFWHLLVGRVAGLASSLLFLGYLVAFLLVLLAAFLSQGQGVMFSHFFGLGLGAIAGIALVMFYRPAGGQKSQSHKSGPN